MNDHAVAVADLRARFARLPPDAPVRLGKSTSNLFRFGAGAPGASRLDVGGLDRVLHVDAAGDTAGGTADVQGMTTYEHLVDATLPHGLMPLVVPQLKTITLGGAVAGLGIESTVVPARAAARVGAGDGDPHRRRAGGHRHAGQRARRPVPRLPELLRHARLRAAAAHRAGAGAAVRAAAAPPLRRRRRVRGRDRRDLSAAPCADRSTSSTARSSARTSCTSRSADFVDSCRPARGPATTPASGSSTGRIQQRDVDFLTVRDYLWRWDTDWFWCSRAFGVQQPMVRPLWPRATGAPTSTGAWSRPTRPPATAQRPALKALRPAAGGDVVQDVEVPVERLAEFLEVFHREVGITPVWLCPLRLRDTEPWPLYPLEPGRSSTSTSGSGRGMPLEPDQPTDRTNRLIEELVAASAGTSRSTPPCTTRARSSGSATTGRPTAR